MRNIVIQAHRLEILHIQEIDLEFERTLAESYHQIL